MAVSFEVAVMRVNCSDFRLRNPQISLSGVSTTKISNLHFNTWGGKKLSKHIWMPYNSNRQKKKKKNRYDRNSGSCRRASV